MISADTKGKNNIYYFFLIYLQGWEGVLGQLQQVPQNGPVGASAKPSGSRASLGPVSQDGNECILAHASACLFC